MRIEKLFIQEKAINLGLRKRLVIERPPYIFATVGSEKIDALIAAINQHDWKDM